MEVDKENIRNKTKIPLPLSPLPAVPHTLLKRQDEIERHPLKTINRQDINVAGISQKTEKDKTKIKSKIPLNTRHITVRQKTEDLDWDYNVFKDDTVKDNNNNNNNNNVFKDDTVKDNIIVIISDDEETNDDIKGSEMRYFIHNRRKNCLGETKKAVTPSLKSPSLEPNRVRNIKRSLKRPHSRELQGLSPMVKPAKGEERHKRRLEFNDRLPTKHQSIDLVEQSYMTCLNRDYTKDLFDYLMDVENTAVVPRINSNTRACVINWLIKLNGSEGNPSTVQYAQWYFDAMLAVCRVPVKNLQLVAVACYWIAQKIHGPYTYARKLVKCSGYAFTSNKLLAAEKEVLITLNFPQKPVIPQEFITYLSYWCDSSRPQEIEEAATFLHMAGVMVDINLCDKLPSVLATAAVRNAVLLLRKKEAMVRLQMNSVFKAVERKTTNLSYICSIQRKAVLLISSPLYEYTAPLVQFGAPPYNIAQKIIGSANELAATRMRPELAE